MIDEGAYRDLGDQLGDAAAMVIVIVGQQHVVDLADARALGCSKNPVGIAAIVVRPSCVDEQRLPGRGDKQRGLATLDIDEVNLKILFGRPCRQACQESGKKSEQDSGEFRSFVGDESLCFLASSRLRSTQQGCWRSHPGHAFLARMGHRCLQSSQSRTGTAARPASYERCRQST